MIAYDRQGKVYVNFFFVLIVIAVFIGAREVLEFFLNRARDKEERLERRERKVCNAIVALNRHAVVVDKVIKRLKRRGK